MVVKVGKYRSRRRAGGNILAAIKQNQVLKAVDRVKKTVSHAMDHEPMEVLKSVEKHLTAAPDHAVNILNDIADDYGKIDPNAINPMQNFVSEFPNFSGPDPFKFARSIREKLTTDAKMPHSDHKRVGGDLFKGSLSAVKSLVKDLNPAHSVHQSFDSLDRIHMNDYSMRGIAKNALHGRAAFLHGAAAYAQSTGLLLAPVTVGSSEAALGGLGMATNKIADAHEAAARRI